MAIKLDNIKNIATIIKTKYGENLHKMNFVFCFKKNRNSYFIFQEIQGMPIKRIVYHESNNSVSFVASWASWSNPYALIADANYDEIENWKDLQDRSRPYNSFIEIDGGFNSSMWKSKYKGNKNEKKRKHKNKTDAFVEFRVDKVERAVFNKNSFELYSPTISMIGFRSRYHFPHQIEGIFTGSSLQQAVDNFDEALDEASPILDEYGFVLVSPTPPMTVVSPLDIVKVSWQGKSFVLSPSLDDEGDFTSLGQGMQLDLASYWDINESDEENEKFDKDIADLILHGKKNRMDILDVGQRSINLNLED